MIGQRGSVIYWPAGGGSSAAPQRHLLAPVGTAAQARRPREKAPFIFLTDRMRGLYRFIATRISKEALQ